MDVQIREEQWSVEAEALEITPFNLNEPGIMPYPLPLVRKSGRFAPSTFRTVTMENDLISVSLCTDLGGRVVAVHDKRTSIDVITRASRVEISEGSRRGAQWRHGIEWYVGEAPSLDSLGPVTVLIREDVGAVFFSGSVLGTTLSWQVCVSLIAGASQLTIESHIYNSDSRPSHCKNGLIYHHGQSRFRVDPAGVTSYDDSTDGIVFFDNQFTGTDVGESITLTSGGEGFLLGPYETVSNTYNIAFHSGLGGLTSANSSLATNIEKEVKISVTRPTEGKLYVQDATGSTLEAEVSFNPSQIFTADLGFRPVRILLKDTNGVELFGAEQGSLWSVPGLHFLSPDQGDATMQELLACSQGKPSYEWDFYVAERQGNSVGRVPMVLKSAGHRHNACLAIRERSFESAVQLLDEALLTNSEDFGLWWLKAVCFRHLNDEEGYESAVLNAHFLAPSDAGLRAEAFLRQADELSPRDNPLIRSLATDPNQLLSVLSKYVEVNLYIDAANLMEAVHEIETIPLVHYMHAYTHLLSSQMVAEAAHHVQLVTDKPLTPPFPWRPIEVSAVTLLHRRFPEDKRLAELKNLIQTFGLT